MSGNKIETYDQLIERVAWNIAQDFVHGTTLLSMTHKAVQQAILWNVQNQKRIAAEDKAARQAKKMVKTDGR